MSQPGRVEQISSLKRASLHTNYKFVPLHTSHYGKDIEGLALERGLYF